MLCEQPARLIKTVKHTYSLLHQTTSKKQTYQTKEQMNKFQEKIIFKQADATPLKFVQTFFNIASFDPRNLQDF